MEMELQNICDNFFRLDEQEGISKVMPLDDAVREFVRPGMSLHFSFTHYRAPRGRVRDCKTVLGAGAGVHTHCNRYS